VFADSGRLKLGNAASVHHTLAACWASVGSPLGLPIMRTGNIAEKANREEHMNSVTSGNVRQVIARHFGVKLDRVVDDARLRDFGADWLDCLELLITIEDQVPDVEINDLVAGQIETVGDLMRACLEDSAARTDPKPSHFDLQVKHSLCSAKTSAGGFFHNWMRFTAR
jgi:acyl carrier protein